MTNEQLLQMTHEELISSTQEVKNLYKNAKHLDFVNKVETGINLGYKHIQIGYCGCIKVRKNENGIFYSIRTGRGNGKDTFQSTNIKDCIDNIKNNGWGNDVTYK
jgi:hypothetical protein